MRQILIIRMLELGDVSAIAVPLVRHLQMLNDDVRITILTHGAGSDIINLAVPEADIMVLANDVWPNEFFSAIEAFLGIAETIIARQFDQIINIDTAFMPNFLSRFLRDAGEPLLGNHLSMSVQTLFQKVEDQSLTADYVNTPQEYIATTFKRFNSWYRDWWHLPDALNKSYGHYFLQDCCEFDGIQMDIDINVSPYVSAVSQHKASIYVAVKDGLVELFDTQRVADLLWERGYHCFIDNDVDSVELKLQKLKTSTLCFCLPSYHFALSRAVGTKTLLYAGKVEPITLGPDYIIDETFDLSNPVEIVDNVIALIEEVL